jgi:hypothetical protein
VSPVPPEAARILVNVGLRSAQNRENLQGVVAILSKRRHELGETRSIGQMPWPMATLLIGDIVSLLSLMLLVALAVVLPRWSASEGGDATRASVERKSPIGLAGSRSSLARSTWIILATES